MKCISVVLAAALWINFDVASAEEAKKPVAAPAEKPASVSKAARMSDEELDKVTAGFNFVLNDNPGNANKLKVTNGVLLCINCGFDNDTIIHTNKNGVHTTCIGAGRC